MEASCIVLFLNDNLHPYDAWGCRMCRLFEVRFDKGKFYASAWQNDICFNF